MDNKIKVEINVDGKWESSYAMRRIDMDKVYKYMDLLQMEETNEVDISDITMQIGAEHERAGI